MTSINAATCLTLGCLLLAGCTLGPDYHGPDSVAPAALKQGFARAPADLSNAQPQASAWWRSLNDKTLDALIDTALRDSPTLQVTLAKLRQARAGAALQRGQGMPKAGASAAYLHAGSAGDSADTDLTLGAFDASWELDLFGANRRAVEGAEAQAQAAQHDVADAQVQLSAEVALNYLGLRDQQQRAALARQSEALEEQTLVLTEQRRAGGTASQLDVERIQTQVQTIRAAIITLDGQVLESLDQLALLCGQAPAALDVQLSIPQPLPGLPANLAIGDPAQLLRQRPDIRAAERELAGYTANIGQQRAGAFPKVSLFGSLSLAATDGGSLLRKDNLAWLGVPYLQWDVLDFGRNAARVNQAEARRDEAQAHYAGVVLAALRDANVALSRFGIDRQNIVAQAQVEASASRAATLTQQRYRAGTSTALGWLDAERTRYSAQQDLIQRQAQLLKDYVALHKSLGLGWQASPPLLTRTP
ncbi:efflux transporter outer membrane subunit [Pseudomonas sp. PB120]|uniref:efflux transporter outer membrane subunit n=1 Tax=Pseudomonas sp. PB120 TaxID=2494700 RepID=UPI0012FD7D3B|nr:efflux transporter outer membrane subunit [Pseudomonas sp. PB120]MVV46662.1 efflux transporter outer membrane subunit [Pseudomonas sp. PB120]